MKCFHIIENFHEFYQKILEIHSNFFKNVKIKFENVDYNDNINNLNETDSLNIPSTDEVFKEEKPFDCDELVTNQIQEIDEYENSKECQQYDYNTLTDFDSKTIDDHIHVADELKYEHVVEKNQLNECLNGVKKYECTECTRSYVGLHSLNQHIREYHEKTKVQICEICGKIFLNYYVYKTHILDIHNISKVECKECGEWVKNERSLQVHMHRKHRKDNVVYKCVICEYIAPNKYALSCHKYDVHINTHKYKCNLCDKAFKRNFSLKRHIETHNREKTYSCRFCSGTFLFSSTLYSHLKIVHPIEWEESRSRRDKISK